MLSRLKWAVVAVLFLPLAAFAARQAPIQDANVPVVEGVSAKQAGDAVRLALVGRKWLINSDKGNRIEATLLVRQHMAKIAVSWDAKSIKIEYLDSAELNFEMKDGQRYIHPNYNKWINLLEKDLPVFMQRVKYGQ